MGTYHCVCPEGTLGNAYIGGCIDNPPSPPLPPTPPLSFGVRLTIGRHLILLYTIFYEDFRYLQRISAGVLVAVIAFLAIKVLLHKRRMKRQALFQHNGGQLLKHMLKVEGNASFNIYSGGDILLVSRNFHKTKIVGQGAHGTVYKVTLDVGGRANATAEFVQELVILCHLIHPNIVKLVGCCLEFEAPMLVYEFVQNGNLNQLLHGRPRHRVSLPTRLRIAAESAEALAHLHTHPVHPVLHGNVKPENILLADGWIAKVSDFGCSTIKDNVQVVPKGTLAYLDPEFLHTFQLTDKGDVCSFGVVLVELLTRKKPRSTSKEEKNMAWIFQGSMRQGTLHELLDKDIVLEESSMVVIKQVAELASRCLAVPSATRPSMEQVAQQLRQLKDQVVEVECPLEVEHDDLGPTEMEMTTVAAVLWLCAVALAASPGTAGRTTTGVVGPPPPSPHNSSIDDSWCLRRCGDVHIPYPFGAGPADSCSVSPELRLYCNDTGNGVHKLFVRAYWVLDTHVDIEVVDIDVIQGQLRVVSHNTTIEGSSQPGYMLPEPYRFSIARNKFRVLGCLTWTYMLGSAYEQDNGSVRWYMAGCFADCRGNYSLEQQKHSTNGSCTGTIQGYEGLRFYDTTFENNVNHTKFNNIYPCAYAMLMDSSYRLNFSISYLAPSNEFNKSRVPVVLDWVIRNKTCGYACISNNSECVNASGGRGYLCKCAEGFLGNPYAKDEHGCKDIDECKDNITYPCHGNCNNKIGTYDCVCPEGTQGNALNIGECIDIPPSPRLPFGVRLAIGISVGVLVAVIAFLAIKVLLHKRRMKKQALFQRNGGLLLKHMLKVEGNASFTVYSRGDILISSRNFHKTKIVGEGAHGTVYKVTLNVGGRATSVAVKRCKAIDESRKKEFVQELVILCHLSHPNIVKLVGCCLEFEAPMLVYEFMHNGNLNQLLHGRPRHRVSLSIRLRIAVESAEALAHLHSHPVHPVLHGDVKPENILLADGWIAKVSDFGCSTIKDNVQVVPKGTLAYLDPEFLHSFQLTDKGDVYSFGVVLVELLTRKKPRSTSKEEKNMSWIFQESLRQGNLNELLDKDIVLEENNNVVIKKVAELASRCLAVPSETRPSMEQVAQQLRQLKDHVVEVECPQEIEDDLDPKEMEMTTGYA
ncbi:hypothetical protein U9M48_000986 [Paspalum notatum var. saurae]|uniref:Protein kinase domain-containing protein n=1 Tax=Paspalum notatum var. saurae TaxID=547442 RepID=A0AAQ3PHM9_PASNO